MNAPANTISESTQRLHQLSLTVAQVQMDDVNMKSYESGMCYPLLGLAFAQSADDQLKLDPLPEADHYLVRRFFGPCQSQVKNS